MAHQLQQREDNANRLLQQPLPQASSSGVTEVQVLPKKTLPPVPFDSQIVQNSLNDPYDEKLLLKRVPTHLRKNALHLISALQELSNEITWDSNGVVYISQSSIPNSNIYKIFPKLFSKTKSNSWLPGFQDFFQKLKSLGLIHLTNVHTPTKQSQTGSGQIEKPDLSGQWWYIGD